MSMSQPSTAELIKRFSKRAPKGPMARLIRRFMSCVPRARGLRIMTAVTLCYLFIEFAFSAWLLDVMAEHASNDVEHAERWGRLLSGIAVTLLIWPVIFAHTRRWPHTIGLLALVSVLVTFAVYQGEKRLIDSLVEHSTADSRAAAVTGTLLRQGLATGTINAEMLDGLWAEPTAQSVAGRAFVGVVAYMAAQSDSALKQTLALAPDVVRGVIEQDTGGLDPEYQRYVESQDTIRYRHRYVYEADVKRFAEEMQKIPARANRDWEHYLDRLEAQNRDWGRARIGRSRGGELVPGFVAPRVRAEVRKQGLDVKDSWSTGDKATFIRLTQEKYRKQMQNLFNQILNGLPTNLGLEAFASHPTVQKRWREELHYPDSVSGLSLAPLTREQFEQRYYRRALNDRTRDGLKSYSNQVADYRNGGPREEEGKQAYEAMIAPVFALTLSLLGALVHLGKTTLLLIHLRSGWRFKNPLVKAALLSTGIVLVLLLARVSISTHLTSHPTYQAWTQSSGKPGTSTLVLDTMIKVQSLAYPVFNLPKQVLEFVINKVAH